MPDSQQSLPDPLSYTDMGRLKELLKEWMLPLALVSGISIYLIYHFIPALHPIGPACHRIVSVSQRVTIAIMLFLQFVKVSPHDLKLTRWHLYAALCQLISSFGVALVVMYTPHGEIRILLECAMICLICPTAAAAGVITDRLGGTLSATMTYVVLINTLATFAIPTMIPLIHPSAELGFWQYVLGIAAKIFPLLLLPCLLAWAVRYSARRLQRFLMRRAHWAFYFWGVGLTLAMILATRALVTSSLGFGVILCIVMVSVAVCALQFFAGRHLGKDHAECITAGQALGQKNTGFMIWLGYAYLTPITSVVGGLYAIWQNIFNSWELFRHEHGK